MIQPGGAMALFVLRLAGLLSLEKALIENNTSTSDSANHSLLLDYNYNNSNNSSSVSNNYRNNSGNNVNKTFNSTFLLPTLEIENILDNVDNSSKEVSPKFSFLKSEHLNTSLNETDKTLKVESTGNNSTDVANNTNRSTDAKQNNGKIVFKNENLDVKTVKNKSTDEFVIQNKKVIKKKRRKPNDASDKDTKEEKYKPNKNAEGNITINSITSDGNVKSTVEPPQHVSSVVSNPSVEPTMAPRNSNTGFSPVVTQTVNNTPLPYFSTSHVQTFPSQSNDSVDKIMKFDDSSFKNTNFQGMDSPSIDFVSKDFDYYNFDGYNNSSEHELPTLLSRSLVSPVTNGKPTSINSTVKETDKKDSDENSAVSAENKTQIANKKAAEVSKNVNKVDDGDDGPKIVRHPKTPIKSRGIGPIPSPKKPIFTPLRNNPYPYGPKVLPDHVLPFDPKLKPKKVPETFGSLFPDREFLYNYDYDFEEEVFAENETEKIFFIKTETPRVLFHFEKPGYSPKLPDSSVPPTRAPTPSDPWDCSPRCPRYTLVDWNPDYDIRQYPVTTWISTVIISDNRILAELEGYMKVQDYFYGLNDRGQLLNMTVPFVTQIKHGRHPGVLEEVTDFSVSLYVNHIDDPLNNDIPTPISNEVLIDRLESKTVFVVGFEVNVWEVTEAFLNNKTSNLMEKLRQNGEAFLDRYFYLASYSRPELYQPVYYELWIYATSFRDHHISSPPMVPRRRPPPNQITTSSINKLCRGVECPPFEVLRTYRYGIQKRRYFDGLFATTSPGGCEFSTISVWKGFMPLHLYKHGINSHLEVLEATRPIGLIHVKENSTSETECPQNMTMAIYLPKRLHANPPQTGYDAPRVEVSALQDVVVYAYTVGGYLLEPDRVRKELADLKYRLTEFGACFKNDEYYVVIYDFIIRYHGRQNEIWVVAENCKATLNG